MALILADCYVDGQFSLDLITQRLAKITEQKKKHSHYLANVQKVLSKVPYLLILQRMIKRQIN